MAVGLSELILWSILLSPVGAWEKPWRQKKENMGLDSWCQCPLWRRLHFRSTDPIVLGSDRMIVPRVFQPPHPVGALYFGLGYHEHSFKAVRIPWAHLIILAEGCRRWWQCRGQKRWLSLSNYIFVVGNIANMCKDNVNCQVYLQSFLLGALKSGVWVQHSRVPSEDRYRFQHPIWLFIPFQHHC